MDTGNFTLNYRNFNEEIAKISENGTSLTHENKNEQVILLIYYEWCLRYNCTSNFSLTASNINGSFSIYHLLDPKWGCFNPEIYNARLRSRTSLKSANV